MLKGRAARGLERVLVLRREVVSARRENAVKLDMLVVLECALMVYLTADGCRVGMICRDILGLTIESGREEQNLRRVTISHAHSDDQCACNGSSVLECSTNDVVAASLIVK